MQTINHWNKFDTAAAVAEAVCADIMHAATQAIAARGIFKLVLAGGTTPAEIYRLLVKQSTDWSKWHIYYGDERCLAADHPDRNNILAEAALLNHVPIPAEQIHVIPAELGNVEAAKRYAETVADVQPFDMVLLGVGEDGHTASLFPGHVHDAEAPTHAVFDSPKAPPERVSLSAKVLSNANRLLFIITGANKVDAVQQWQNGVHLPVCLLEPVNGVEIYIDRAALGE